MRSGCQWFWSLDACPRSVRGWNLRRWRPRLVPGKGRVDPAAEAQATDTMITLSLINVPISEALRYAAKLAVVTLRSEAATAVLDR